MNSTHPVIPEPSTNELSILRILWKHGPCSLKDINSLLMDHEGHAAMNATFKQLHVMENKRFIRMQDKIYTALMDEHYTRNLLLDKFLHTHFDGSHEALISLLQERVPQS